MEFHGKCMCNLRIHVNSQNSDELPPNAEHSPNIGLFNNRGWDWLAYSGLWTNQLMGMFIKQLPGWEDGITLHFMFVRGLGLINWRLISSWANIRPNCPATARPGSAWRSASSFSLVFFSRSWRSFDPMWISASEKNTKHLYMGYKWHVNEMYIIYDIIKWDMNGIPWI